MLHPLRSIATLIAHLIIIQIFDHTFSEDLNQERKCFGRIQELERFVSPAHHPAGYFARDHLRLSRHHTLAGSTPLTPSPCSRTDHTLSLYPTTARPDPARRPGPTRLTFHSSTALADDPYTLPAPGGCPSRSANPPAPRAFALRIIWPRVPTRVVRAT